MSDGLAKRAHDKLVGRAAQLKALEEQAITGKSGPNAPQREAQIPKKKSKK